MPRQRLLASMETDPIFGAQLQARGDILMALIVGLRKMKLSKKEGAKLLGLRRKGYQDLLEGGTLRTMSADQLIGYCAKAGIEIEIKF